MVINLADPKFPQAPHSGIFAFDTGGSLMLQSLAADTRMDNLNNIVLTGTTGTADHTSLTVRTGNSCWKTDTQANGASPTPS